MILDRALFDSTSYGSAKKIRCRCDVCGEEKLIAKQKLVARGDEYARCRTCHYNRNPVKSKEIIDAACFDCGAPLKRRADSMQWWKGRCSSCASKEIAARPDVKEAMRANGIAVMKRVGKLPHYPDRNYRRGAANNKWKGGITPANQQIRLSPEMRAWSRSVLERDDFTCILCKKRGGNLHADHIKPFAIFVSLRFDLNNGRTLCAPCHARYGSKVEGGIVVREAVMSLEAVG